MQYKEFGKTGKKVSILGFGAMRLPEKEINGKACVLEDESIEVIQRGFQLGINIIDSHPWYCRDQSEPIVGKALKGWREKVFVSTKLATSLVTCRDDFQKSLDVQLKRLQIQYIDFYHFHSMNKDRFENKVLKFHLLEEMERAKSQGLIKHISFSIHDQPNNIKAMLDLGIFETFLCQYNLLDQKNEEVIAYAKEKGIGVSIMGPVGGGRLQSPSEEMRSMVNRGIKSTPELALRFVLANKNVDVAYSGMSTIQMVLENVKTASDETLLTQQERSQIIKIMEEKKRLADLYCTSCKYCMPCPNNINIPANFRAMIFHQVYGLEEFAKQEYGNIKAEEKANLCAECGKCEEKCPQKLEIRKKLKETAIALT